MLLSWHESAWTDYLWWQTQDRKTLRRLNALIQDIQQDGSEDRPPTTQSALDTCELGHLDIRPSPRGPLAGAHQLASLIIGHPREIPAAARVTEAAELSPSGGRPAIVQRD